MRFNFTRHVIFTFICLMLFACNQADMLEKTATPEEIERAQRYIDLVQKRQFAEIEKIADPGIVNANLPAALAQISDAFPPGEPTVKKLVGAHRLNTNNDGTTINLTFEYDFSGKYVLTNAAFKTLNNKVSLAGISAYRQAKSLEEISKFELVGKSWLHYLVLVLAIAFPVFSLGVLVLCIRTKLKGRKWPWILFIIFGLGQFALNWNTGAWAVSPLSLYLLSGFGSMPLYQEPSLGISLPLGAIIFLLTRRRLMRPDAS
jgi:hypothetical protein